MKKLLITFLVVGLFSVWIGALIGLAQDKFFKTKTTTQTIILSPTPTPVKNLDSMKIYNLVNDYRASQGLNKLVFDPSMCDYTKTRVQQVKTDWSHNGFKSNLPPYKNDNNWAGENLAREYGTDEQVFKGWINSPTHLENIVKPVYSRTCIETDSQYVVQSFASY